MYASVYRCYDVSGILVGMSGTAKVNASRLGLSDVNNNFMAVNGDENYEKLTADTAIFSCTNEKGCAYFN